MPRLSLALLTLMFAGACGTTEDDRPATLEYVTQTILAPACGNAECHSSFKTQDGWRLDTVKAVEESVRNGILIIRNAENPDDIESTLMLTVLTRTIDRMPYDQPLSQPDLDLIREWVSNDATTLDDARTAHGFTMVSE